MSLRIDSAKVPETAGGWDTEHLHLEAAATDIDGTKTGGFTPNVKGVVTDFVASWTSLVRKAGQDAEKTADDLRSAALNIIRSDSETAGLADMYAKILREQR
jgi:hypothetical protein